MRFRPSSLVLVAFCLAALGTASGSRAADDDDALRLRAFAVDLAGTTSARTDTLDIAIKRWSTPAEVARLRAAMLEKGEAGLLEALQKLEPVGHIRNATSIGWDLHFSQQVRRPDGSRRIFIATDRPMSFWETVNRPRSADYQFLLAEVRLGPDGKGQGKLVPAAKIDYDDEDKTLYIEEWGREPVRLTEVKVVK
ncbi:MAG TPA: hypothetical protein VMR21_02895 [Vicinamibacteria bacterium]|nr:hypothetical protein [Vicinamibacteria bacterium]